MRNQNKRPQTQSEKHLTRRWLHSSAFGFTLIEMVVGIAIMAILVSGIMSVFTLLSRSIKLGREKAITSTLAASYMEIARNLPYSKIGTTSGNPNGSLPDQTTPTVVNILGTTYNIYYNVTYIDDPADGTLALGTDAYPNDYKQVKMTVLNTSNSTSSTFVTNISPKGLESSANAGSLILKVIDANGQPVSNASVHIQKTDNSIILDRLTDNAGSWNEFALPAGVNVYHIVVTKGGYSTDQTYPISGPNPNPTKPDATIQNGTATSITFAIDTLANLTMKTLDQSCSSLNGIRLNLAGAKLIGTNPNVLKFNNTYTSANGAVVLNGIEWDNYSPTLANGQTYTIMGTSPIQSIGVLPGSSQIYTILLAPQSANSLLTIVRDAGTSAAIEGARVHLNSGANDYVGFSGGSSWLQTDWSGGSGQANFAANNRQYFSDNGGINATDPNNGIKLFGFGGFYAPSGQLISSTFDTGTALTQYSILSWAPTAQDPATSVKFQLAANNDNATWNFVGPDGTGSTYYTVSGSTISNTLNNKRYVRYAVYESTTDLTKSPNISNITVNYVSGCQTPGQSYFGNLPSGTYTIDVSLSGYQTTTVNNVNINGNQSLQILLSH